MLKRAAAFLLSFAVISGLLAGAGPVAAVSITSSIKVWVTAPAEAKTNDTFTATVGVTVPQDTEVYGLDLSLFFETRFLGAESCELSLPEGISGGSLQISEGQVQFLYDSISTPLPEGELTLFTAEITVGSYDTERETRLDIYVREAYSPYINEEDQLVYIDLDVITEPASVYLGERFRITPEAMTVCMGNQRTVTVNKAYTHYHNPNEDIVSFDPDTKTITALAEGTADITFYTEGGEMASIQIQVCPPDARLDTLLLGNGVLTPAFHSDTYQYTAEIPWKDECLQIESARPVDDLATVTVDNPALKAGEEGVVTIQITSQDGQKKIYTINVTRQEKQDDGSTGRLLDSLILPVGIVCVALLALGAYLYSRKKEKQQ